MLPQSLAQLATTLLPRGRLHGQNDTANVVRHFPTMLQGNIRLLRLPNATKYGIPRGWASLGRLTKLRKLGRGSPAGNRAREWSRSPRCRTTTLPSNALPATGNPSDRHHSPKLSLGRSHISKRIMNSLGKSLCASSQISVCHRLLPRSASSSLPSVDHQSCL